MPSLLLADTLKRGQFWKACTETVEPACIYSRIIKIENGYVTHYFSTEAKFKLKLQSTTSVSDYKKRFTEQYLSEYDFVDHSFLQLDNMIYRVYFDSRYTNAV
jgi:hypothetical protein